MKNSVAKIKAFAFHYAPRVIKERILAYNENKKMEHWQECFKVKVSKEQVDELFSKMDLDSDVMIHSSLPDIGNIKLRYVTENLKQYVLDTGHTILCPALPIKGSSFDYLASIKEFDVRIAPNAMGAISSYYGQQDGSMRSLSPTHSVIAFGCLSSYYTNEHHLAETPFTEKSPYFKLVLKKGKILMFGATLKNFTFNHVIEDLIGEDCYPVRVYDPRRFEIRLVDSSGQSQSKFFRAHSHKNSWMIDGYELMGKVYTLPSTKVFSLGCGDVLLLDARDVCLCELNQLKSGLTIRGHRRVSKCCIRKADYWIDYISQL